MKKEPDLPAVLIPVFQPSSQLPELVKELGNRHFNRILIVNDGSSPDTGGIFRNLEKEEAVTVIHHKKNRGKGAAIKSGLNHFLRYSESTNRIITVDADGQHLPDDILAVALDPRQDSLVLGVRDLDRKIPLRSRLGNTVTRSIFSFYTGLHLKDTQTGLRKIPGNLIPRLLEIDRDRYDFEMEMLYRVIVQWKVPVAEVPISTIYEPGNPTSHFNPLMDSLRILRVLFTHYPMGLKFHRKKPEGRDG